MREISRSFGLAKYRFAVNLGIGGLKKVIKLWNVLRRELLIANGGIVKIEIGIIGFGGLSYSCLAGFKDLY